MNDDVLTGRLRLSKPSQLRVFVSGRDDSDLIAVSAKRDRWKRCVDILSSMAWVRIECLDTQGRIVETLEQDDDTLPTQSKLPEPQSQEERWLNLMINAQRLALENHAHMLSPLIDGYVRLADTFGSRLAALEKHFDRTLDVAYQNAILQAQVDGAAGDGADAAIVSKLIDKMGGQKTPPKKQLKTKGNHVAAK